MYSTTLPQPPTRCLYLRVIISYCLVKPFTFLSLGMRILSYATAVFDYAATATTQLSLSKGDRVMVLSKTGQDKGWWKGEHCATGTVGGGLSSSGKHVRVVYTPLNPIFI